MGYILPVPHFQYRDYHQRTIQTPESPYTLQQPYKVTFDKKMIDKDVDHEKYRKDDEKSIHLPASANAATSEKIFAELTGKGRHFSESI
ncbi:hypothetical protein [Thalassobacillus hwangdonensis]|uniref:Uncharacterized protein n=1 Tax=Thalassobacillus hwangdonensis TaxID=546108 RepID=A0ABW3KVI3_9BACI